MAMTYNSLIAALPSYLDRTDASIAAQYDNFIFLAQQRMVVDLDKNLGLQSYQPLTLVVGTNTYNKPTGWKRNMTLSYKTATGVITPIDLRTYEYCTMYSPNPTTTGAPQFYSEYGFAQIYIAPTPDFAYVCNFGILQLPTVLAVGTQTNWFTDNAPHALLKACVLEAFLYQKNYEQIPAWKEDYAQEIQALQEQNDVRVTDRASDRSSTP